jgi:hypothetical protein
MVDENTPIRWTIILKDRMEQFLHYENTEGGVREYYSTSELLELVKREGFGEWRQSKVNEKQGEFLISEYQIPDLTPYPID